MTKKTINLMNKCEKELNDLSALEFTAVAREKIVARAIAISSDINNDVLDKLIKNYIDAFTTYENAKNNFYTTFILPYVDEHSDHWDLNYSTGDVTIYELD